MNKDAKDCKVAIVGSGLAGLSTAYHLKKDYVLFEKEAEAGGMTRSVRKNGYVFDYDGHLLHFRTKYALYLVKKLLNGNFASHKRSSWIYLRGRYVKYPFQANFYGLPQEMIKDCLVALIKARVNPRHGQDAHSGNFEMWVRQTFGDGIAEHFMLPYNKKFWTVEPKELTCEWLDGFVPVPSLEDSVAGAVSNNQKPYGYNSTFWYPVKGGISELVKGFMGKLQNVQVNKNVVKIDQFSKILSFADGSLARFENMISTMPLPEMAKMLKNIPPDVKSAFSKLRYTSIYTVNMGIKRRDLAGRHWVYYPEKDKIFYRLGFPASFSMNAAPPRRTSIYAEISYSGNKRLSLNGAVEKTIKDLKKIGIIRAKKDIEICMPLDIKYGYVIYDPNRNRALSVIKDYLKKFDIYPIGRYGGWKYLSMEDVILEGKKTALQVTGNRLQRTS